MMRKIYNCNDCLYANFLKNGDVYCDKRELEGVEVIIKNNKIHINCHCHSGYPQEETRYDRPWKYTYEADDVCEICHRFLNLQDESQYTYVEVEKDNGSKDVVRKCRICMEKGR